MTFISILLISGVFLSSEVTAGKAPKFDGLKSLTLFYEAKIESSNLSPDEQTSVKMKMQTLLDDAKEKMGTMKRLKYYDYADGIDEQLRAIYANEVKNK